MKDLPVLLNSSLRIAVVKANIMFGDGKLGIESPKEGGVRGVQRAHVWKQEHRGVKK